MSTPENKTTKPAALLNLFSTPTVLCFVVLAVWYVRPYFDRVDAHDAAINKTTAAVESLAKITEDLQSRVKLLEAHK